MKNIWCKRDIRRNRLRDTRREQTDNLNNPATRGRTENGNEDNETATIKIFGRHKEINLVNLRMLLVFLNLTVLGASFVSYLAWMDAKYNWELANSDRPDRSILSAMEYLPVLSPSSQKIVASVHGHLDQLLYLTAFNLFLYWVIYGFVISCRFGGTCDICTVVVSLPHTVIMVVWEIGIALAVLRVKTIFSSLPWDKIVLLHSQHYKDLRYVHEFYATWGPWIVSLYLLSVPVQLFLVCLPFLVSKLPFQADYEKSYEMTEQGREVEEQNIDQSELLQGSEVNGVRKKRQSLVKLITSPQRKIEDLSACCKRTHNIREGVHSSYQQTRIPNHTVTTTAAATTQSSLNSLHQGEIVSLHGQVPNESRNYCRSLVTEKYNCACKAISAGKAVIETMGRTYHVHNSSRPLWNLLEKPVLPHFRLAARDCLAEGVTFYNDHYRRNYLNMASSCSRSPPPPYSLHPQQEATYVNVDFHHPEQRNEDDQSSYVDQDPHFEMELDIDSPANHDCTYVTTDRAAQVDENTANDNVLEESFNGQQDWSETSIII